MDNGHYENKTVLFIESINDPVISDNDFSVRKVGEFGHTMAQKRKL